MKDWIWIWGSGKLLNSNKADTFRACNTGNCCAKTTSSLRSLLLQVLPPHPEHILIHFRPTFLHWQFRMEAQAVLQPQLTIWKVMIMIVIAWQRPERLALGMGFGKIDKVNWNISVLYRNASSYHRIDVVTLTDTRRGNMVFLTKLTDRGSSNMSLNDMHWFNMTESYKHYTILHCTWKPCRDHSVCALRQSEPVLYFNAGSDWLRAYTE